METSLKKARIRSVAYPSYTIQSSIELTTKINQKFGNTMFVKREDISQELNISEGHIQTQLSSAGYYGLIELKSGEGYKPSSSFISIYKPLSEEERHQEQVNCLLQPELYSQLIARFDGKQVPELGGLAIILFRQYKVSEDASQKAAKIFLENLEDLKLLDNGILKVLDNTTITSENLEFDTEPHQVYPVPQIINDTSKKNETIDISSQLVDAPPIPIFLKGGRIAKLLMPMGFTDEDLDKVITVLGVYKNGS